MLSIGLRRRAAVAPASSTASRQHLRDAERWLEPDRRPRRRPAAWSSSTRRSSRRCRPGSRCTAPRWRWRPATRRPPSRTPAARSTSSARTTTSGAAAAAGLLGLASWATRRPRAPRTTPTRLASTQPAAGRPPRRHPRAARSPWPTSESPRAASRDALRTYERALRRQRRARVAGAARHRRHVRRHERAPPRARRPGRGRAAPARPQRAARRAHRRCRRTRTAGGSRWPGLREAEGDLDGALDAARRGRAACTSATSSPTSGRSPPCGRGCSSRQGRARRAVAWARERGLSADDELSYLREYEHLTLARVLLAQQAPLDRRRRPAARPAAGGGRGRRPDRNRHRDPGAAGARPPGARRRQAAPRPLERALTLAEPEGYVAGVRRRGRADGASCCERRRAAAPRRRYVRATARLAARTAEPTGRRRWSTRSASASSTCSGCSPATWPARRSPASSWSR